MTGKRLRQTIEGWALPILSVIGNDERRSAYFRSAHGLALATNSCHVVGFSSKIYTRRG